MGHRIVLLILLLAASVTGSGAEDTEEVVAQLSRWQEDPLDLLVADPADLAILPGWDADLARAVVELREARELSALEDLLRIPGVARVQIELLRPYVRIGTGGTRRSGRWRAQGQDRSGEPAWRQRVDAGAGPLEIFALARGRGPSQILRGAARVRATEESAFLGGDLVLRGAPTLFAFSPSRSDVGPAPFLPSPEVRPRTDSSPEAGLRGAAFGFGPRGFVFAGRDADSRLHGGGVVRFGGRLLTGGLALGAGESGPAGAEVTAIGRDGPAQVWVLAAFEGEGRFTGIGVRLEGGRWRAGMDASSCAGRFRHGVDPVSGRGLDRDRRVVQAHLRLREADWSLAAYAREIRTGSIAPTTGSRLEFELRRSAIRPGRPGVSARLRLLPAARASTSISFAVPSGVLRFGLESLRSSAGATEAWSVDWLVSREGQDLRAGLTSVAGVASRMGLVTRPGVGVYPVWVAPGEFLLRAGAGHEAARGRVSAWAWFRAGEVRESEIGLGMAFELRAGEMVRRLQGIGWIRPGTGGSATDPAAQRMAP